MAFIETSLARHLCAAAVFPWAASGASWLPRSKPRGMAIPSSGNALGTQVAWHPSRRVQCKSTLERCWAGRPFGRCADSFVGGERTQSARSGNFKDAVQEAQTSRECRRTTRAAANDPRPLRPLQHPCALVARSGSAAGQGRETGFVFARDPLNAKQPMQTFDEIMKADVADKAKVMAAQRRAPRDAATTSRRSSIPSAKMSRGKPLPVGPTARLAGRHDLGRTGQP